MQQQAMEETTPESNVSETENQETTSDPIQDAYDQEDNDIQETDQQDQGEADDSASEIAEDAEFTEDQKAEYAGKAKKTIDRLTARYHSEREAKEQAAKQVEELQAKLSQYENPDQGSQEPKSEDFNNYGDYVKAMIDYGVKQQVQALGLGQQQSPDQQQQDPNQPQQVSPEMLEKAEQWRKSEEALIKKDPEYSEKVSALTKRIDNGNPEASVALADFVLDSNVGAEILLELANDPVLEIELLSMSPTRAVLKFGEIESRLLAQKERNKKVVPQNEPPKPLDNSSASIKDESELSGRELRKRAGLI